MESRLPCCLNVKVKGDVLYLGGSLSDAHEAVFSLFLLDANLEVAATAPEYGKLAKGRKP